MASINVKATEWAEISKIIKLLQGNADEQMIIPDDYQNKIFYDQQNDTLHIRRIRAAKKTEHSIFTPLEDLDDDIFSAPVTLQPVTRINDMEIKDGVAGLEHSFIVSDLKTDNPLVIALGRSKLDGKIGGGANGTVVEGLSKRFDSLEQETPGQSCVIKKIKTTADDNMISRERDTLAQQQRHIASFERAHDDKQYHGYIVQQKIAGEDLQQLKTKHYGDFQDSQINFLDVIQKVIDRFENYKLNYGQGEAMFSRYSQLSLQAQDFKSTAEKIGLSGMNSYKVLNEWLTDYPIQDDSINLKQYIQLALEESAKIESLPKSKMLAYSIVAAEELQSLHEAQKIMVDFKAENLVGKQEINDAGALITQTKLVDFGSSHKFGQDESPHQYTQSIRAEQQEARARGPVHTALYAAPEVLGVPGEKSYRANNQGYIYSTSTDAFALGKTMQIDFGLENSLAAKFLTKENPEQRMDLSNAIQLLKLEFVWAAMQEFKDSPISIPTYISDVAPEHRDLNLTQIQQKILELVTPDAEKYVAKSPNFSPDSLVISTVDKQFDSIVKKDNEPVSPTSPNKFTPH